ncbi:MAG: hemolysin family protein [Candidatus Omnitrophica bacterium]|nr:hemolysin family protein [Candidatus Omnitrophota bacterium]
MIILIYVIFLLILSFVSFLLSASEMAIISTNKIRLRHLVEKGAKNAVILQRLLTHSDKLVTLILILNNFINICFSAIVTVICINTIGPQWAVAIATLSVTLYLLVFCEITPKIFALQYSEKLALFIAPAAEFLTWNLQSFIFFFTKISNLLIRAFGGTPGKRSPLITEEELRLMIEMGKEEGLLSDEEKRMLHRTFEFGDIKVGDVMVGKENIVGISKKATQEELVGVLAEEGHSRIAVYDGTIDNIIGVLYVHDLLYVFRNGSLFILEDLIHPAYYVPPTLKVNELLRQFQQKRIQIAIVVDTNKKTLGLVTLEDLIEEIVGDIEEENIDTFKD